MGTCLAFVAAHLLLAQQQGVEGWAEEVGKSHEYHACLVVHSCMPDTIVDPIRSPHNCRELVISPGSKQEKRLVR